MKHEVSAQHEVEPVEVQQVHILEATMIWFLLQDLLNNLETSASDPLKKKRLV